MYNYNNQRNYNSNGGESILQYRITGTPDIISVNTDS